MAIGVDIIKTTGRLIFDLQRGDETTTRTIDIPHPVVDPEAVQTVVNNAEAVLTDSSTYMNLFMQPANWRDSDTSELQWRTTHIHYEIVTTSITPVEPDEPEPEPTLAGGRSEEAQADERSQENEGQPQGEWQG